MWAAVTSVVTGACEHLHPTTLGAIAMATAPASLSCILCTHLVSEVICGGKWVPGGELITAPFPEDPAYDF